MARQTYFLDEADDLGLSPKQDREVRAVLAQWERERQRLCQARMQLAAKEGGERRLLADGEVQMMIDPYSYHYWGQRLGYQCWQDPGFKREFLRDNPEARVKSRADKLTLLVAGSGEQGAGSQRKFRKVYQPTTTTT